MTCGFIKGYGNVTRFYQRVWECHVVLSMGMGMSRGFIKGYRNANGITTKGGTKKTVSGIFGVFVYTPFFHPISRNLRPFQMRQRRIVKKKFI